MKGQHPTKHSIQGANNIPKDNNLKEIRHLSPLSQEVAKNWLDAIKKNIDFYIQGWVQILAPLAK